jgi:ATP-binding cassette subfamily B protein
MNYDYNEYDYSLKFDFGLLKKALGLMMKFKSAVIILYTVNTTVSITDTIFPLLNMYALRLFVEQKNISSFGAIFLVIAALYVVQAASIYTFIYQAGKLEVGIVYEIRRRLFENIQSLSFSYFDKTPVGWTISRVASDAQLIGDFLAWAFPDIFWSGAVILIAFAQMFFINARLSFYILASIPPLFAASWFFQSAILKNNREVRRCNSKITGAINESIMGAKTTKTLVRETENLKEFSAMSEEMRLSSMRLARYASLYFPVINVIVSATFGAIFIVGGDSVAKNSMDIAAFTLFINYLIQIFEHIQNLTRIFSEMQRSQVACERTFSLIEKTPDITDSEEVIKEYGDALNPKTENWKPITGAAEFRNVSFTYAKEPVLENFNLTAKAGEKIALVGETGSGKSTIVNLLCRFYEPQSGQILIDGVDIKKRSQIWIRRNLGYVLQTPQLFSGTVAENIRYGKLDATDEEMEEAAKLTDAYGFIMELENGFNTDIGEDGARLSQGQRQLISFARAVIANPKFFILDEATSSVDTKTEAAIQKAILKSLEGRTCFIVAHRLSTIRFCDRIIVIKDGRIIESGTHKQLLKNKGFYYNLYINQFADEESQKILRS